jgi:KaiC/GvpD/RAD55 family RecA-like ATPase
MRLENVIFSNLISNEDFARKTLPYLKAEYFADTNEKVLFTLIERFVDKYNTLPTKDVLKVELSQIKGLTEDQFKQTYDIVKSIEPDNARSQEWLLNETEKFCQDKAIYNAILQSIKIMDNQEKNLDKGAIPELLTKALGVSFDNSIGVEFLEDLEARYKYYHTKQKKIPFSIGFLNKITKGGFGRKTINIFLAGTGVGKSLTMCSLAADNLMMGHNVLYITMEMAEYEIAKRIDANILDLPIQELEDLPHDTFMSKMERVRGKTKGKLVIKEYPTASAGAGNFRHLLNELRLKKNFTPDVVYIDYLNICASSRIKNGSNVNSYSYIKAIAEELRGLAVEFDVTIVTATQTTRSGYSDSDVDITDVSESFGVAHTADFMAALITSEELEGLGQLMVKQLKNRYNDLNYIRRFVVGIDRSRMKLFNLEESAQDDIHDDRPVFDKSATGEKFDKEKFKGFR